MAAMLPVCSALNDGYKWIQETRFNANSFDCSLCKHKFAIICGHHVVRCIIILTLIHKLYLTLFTMWPSRIYVDSDIEPLRRIIYSILWCHQRQTHNTPPHSVVGNTIKCKACGVLIFTTFLFHTLLTIISTFIFFALGGLSSSIWHYITKLLWIPSTQITKKILFQSTSESWSLVSASILLCYFSLSYGKGSSQKSKSKSNDRDHLVGQLIRFLLFYARSRKETMDHCQR